MSFSNVYYPAFDCADINDGLNITRHTEDTDPYAEVIDLTAKLDQVTRTEDTSLLTTYDDYAAAPIGSVVSKIKGYPTWEKISLNCWTDGLVKRSNLQMSRYEMVLDYWAEDEYQLYAA